MHDSGSAMGESAGALRYAGLAIILLDLALIGVRVLRSPSFFGQPGAHEYLLAPALLLVVYAGMALAITARVSAPRSVALRTGTTLGLLAGALWVVNLSVETFTNLSNAFGILGTAPFLLGGFALWGIAGFLGARRTGAPRLGVLSAVWGAMVCALLTITYGFLLLFTALPRLQHDLTDDPDWLRSGWDDLPAFAIANTFNAGFTHLLGALLIGTAVGAMGSALGMIGSRRHD